MASAWPGPADYHSPERYTQTFDRNRVRFNHDQSFFS